MMPVACQLSEYGVTYMEQFWQVQVEVIITLPCRVVLEFNGCHYVVCVFVCGLLNCCGYSRARLHCVLSDTTMFNCDNKLEEPTTVLMCVKLNS